MTIEHNDKEIPMGRVTTRPEALITTPTANTWCADCDVQGVRYDEERHVELHEMFLASVEGDGRPITIDELQQLERLEARPAEFAHCPSCGTTELLDDRSPFEVLDEANRNACDGTVDAGVRLGRFDVAERVAKVAAQVPAEHLSTCGDCARWARIVGVR